MIENYDNKMAALIMLQKGVINGEACTLCALTGQRIMPIRRDGVYFDALSRTGGKLDLCHITPRTKSNREKYPLFIDSLANLVLGLNSAQMNTYTLPYPAERRLPDTALVWAELFLNHEQPGPFKSGQATRAFISGVLTGVIVQPRTITQDCIDRLYQEVKLCL